LTNGYGGGSVGESRAAALRANLIVQIICGQVDYPTRKNRQDAAGLTKQWMKQLTPQPQGEDRISHSEQYLPALPEEWMLGLENGFRGFVEAFVFKGDLCKWNKQKRMLVRWYRPLGKGWFFWSPIFERHATARPWACSVSWRDFWRLLNRHGLRRACLAWADFRVFSMVRPNFNRNRRSHV
jgi:hypothetical protein